MKVRRYIRLVAGISIISILFAAGGAGFAQETAKPSETKEKAAPAQPEKALPEKVATVNGVTISGAELSRQYAMYLQGTGQRAAAVPQEQKQKVRSEILNGLIDQELLYQESRKLGIQIDNAAVNGQFDTFRQRYKTEDEYQADLKSMQMSEVEVKNQIKRSLAIREVINQKVVNGIVIDEAETRSFYDANPQFFTKPDQVKASHILIMVDKSASDEEKAAARKKIEGIRKQAEGGTPFAELANTHSDDGSKQNGGDLGFFKRGMMVKPFEDAAFSLEKDQLSGVVETQYGYHLIKVTDKTPEEKVAFAEVKDRISAHLKQGKVEKEARGYIDTLKKSAKVDKF